VIEFIVLGVPVPQGSKVPGVTKTGRRFVREANPKTKAWRVDVADAAREQAAVHGCLDGPLQLWLTFRFPMPPSRPAKVRAAGVAYKDTAPDREKLARAVADALKAGGLIVDDARIAVGHVCKLEVWQQWTGVIIKLDRLEPYPSGALNLEHVLAESPPPLHPNPEDYCTWSHCAMRPALWIRQGHSGPVCKLHRS